MEFSKSKSFGNRKGKPPRARRKQEPASLIYYGKSKCLFLSVGKRQRSKDIPASDRHRWVNRFISNGCACWRSSSPVLVTQRLPPALGRPVALGKQKAFKGGWYQTQYFSQMIHTLSPIGRKCSLGVINSFLTSKVYVSTENYVCSSWAGKGRVGMRWS